jgi:hypothetical protein
VAGSFSPPSRGDVDQLVIRNAAPEEEREPRGQIEIAQAIGRAGGDACRFTFEPEQELRVDQQPRQRALDAALEAGALAS